MELTLSALDYEKAYDRGKLVGWTMARSARFATRLRESVAVDEFILGSKRVLQRRRCLHEPWLAQLGLAINDSDYCRAFSDTLDFQRQHAIGADGASNRAGGRPGDEMCGSTIRGAIMNASGAG